MSKKKKKKKGGSTTRRVRDHLALETKRIKKGIKGETLGSSLLNESLGSIEI
jgi:hypothetical protein